MAFRGEYLRQAVDSLSIDEIDGILRKVSENLARESAVTSRGDGADVARTIDAVRRALRDEFDQRADNDA